MREDSFNEAPLVRYLLGDLPEEEQAEIEDRAFRDPQYLRMIQAVEGDLIDEYVRGGLSKAERGLFEARFLASAERRRKVEFARDLAAVIPEFAPGATRARRETGAPPATWKTSFVGFVYGLAPASRFALAAAIALVLLGGAWFLLETARLRAQLREQQARHQEPPEQRSPDERARIDDLSAELQREQQRREQLEQLVTQLERENATKTQASRPTVASLILMSGISRGSANRQKLLLKESTRLVRLQIDIEPTEDYESFRVEISDDAGQQVWTRGNLSARTERRVRAIVLNLPSAVLKAGGYEVSLKGLTSDKRSEVVGYYYFDVVKE